MNDNISGLNKSFIELVEKTGFGNNISVILKAADMDFSNVVKCSIFMKSMDDYAKINKVYALSFINNPPAREAVEVSALPKNVNVEISVVAIK